MTHPTRTVSVGITRLMRLVEVDLTIPADYEPKLLYRVEQAVKDPLTKKWEWKPLATTPNWGEGHGALHQMQDDMMRAIQERNTTFVRA